jgi:hypothetical protein
MAGGGNKHARLPATKKRKTNDSTCSTNSASIATNVSSQRFNSSVVPPTVASYGVDDEGSAVIGQESCKTADTPPKELFVESTEVTRNLGTSLTVSSLVGMRLFPHIKFLCNPTVELMYNRNAKSICGIILSECNPPVNVPEHEWWEHAQKWILRQVCVLRSSKNTQMKWSFMRK